MRIVYLGTPEAAVPSMRALVAAGHELSLVVTRPDRPVGRSRRPVPPPVKRAAEDLGLEVAQPRGVRGPRFRQRVADIAPDLLAVVAYGRILPPPLLALPRLGAVNLHFSLLPAYRGAAPVQWSLANGDPVTGVTTMQIADRLDEGAIYQQRELPIEPGEHAPELESRLADLGAGLLVETVAALAAGKITARPQDAALATLAPMLLREHGQVSPGLSARQLEGRVRGFDPWPGVWVIHRGRRLRIVEAVAVDGPPRPELSPGELVEAAPRGLEMICGEGSRLVLRRVQPEGKRVLTISDALNGRQLAAGERLEAVTREP